jgi:hypothetical protein
MSGIALAYDMFGSDYSDAQQLSASDKFPPKGPTQEETSSVGLDSKTSVYVVPVKEFGNREYLIRLRSPIPVLLEGEHNQYVAIHEDSRICGEGKDAQTAIRDFGNAFIAVYFSYRESRDPLSSGAKNYLHFLNQLIDKVEKI